MIELLIILLLLLCNGCLALYEIAFVSSSKIRLSTYKTAKATTALRLLEKPEDVLSTIQIGITLIGIGSGAYGGATLANYVHPVFGDWSIAVVVAVITYLSLVVGELVPKSIGLRNPERCIMLLSPIMTVLIRLFYPFVKLLSYSTHFLNKLIGIKGERGRIMTQEELLLLLRQSGKDGVIGAQRTELLSDAFRFADKTVSELMTHRTEVVAISIHATRKEMIETVRQAGFSKYPLIDGTIDNIVGVVSVKDLFMSRSIMEYSKPPLYIPDLLTADKALAIFKKHKQKFGIVVNEHGDIDGIITFADLSYSILGDIEEIEDDNDTARDKN